MSRALAVALALASATGGCSGEKRKPRSSGAVDACLAALRAAKAAPDRAAVVFARECGGVYAEPACRYAWSALAAERAGERLARAPAAMEACRAAYCPRLTPAPAACAAPIPSAVAERAAAWSELQLAILERDLGRAEARRFIDELQKLAGETTSEELVIVSPRVTDDSIAVSLLVRESGVWIGTTVGLVEKIACQPGYDWPRVSRSLADLRRRVPALAERRDIEVAGDDRVAYHALIAALDQAIANGFSDVAIVTPDAFSARFPPADPNDAPCEPRATGSTPRPTPAANGARPDAPVVAITEDGLTFDGRALASLPDLDSASDEPIAALRDELVAASRALEGSSLPEAEKERLRGSAIVRADVRASPTAIRRVLTTLRAAGYVNVALATSPATP